MTYEDMKEMIRQEIVSIPVLEERILFKELMEQVFLDLYETTERMYLELEQRVQEELAYDVNRYQIRTGIMERSCFDTSHHFFAPMEESDLEVKSYHMADIVEGMEKEGCFSMMKIMLRCDYLQLKKLWGTDPIFEGVIETENPRKSCKIFVRLRQNTEYLQKVGILYRLFIKNGIPWQTINAPYLYKLADVVVDRMPDGVSGNEKIRQVQIDFGKYKEMISCDMLPVWNVRKLILDGVGFPVPCEDHRNFEHRLSIHEYGAQHAYLAEDESDIQSIIQRKEKLLIISDSRRRKKWEFYQIRNTENRKTDHYDYPVMQNERIENFSERYQQKWNQSIKTRAELERFIRGFHLEKYICYQGCEVLEEFDGKNETYSMNPFIEDEIRDKRSQKKLLLCFKAGMGEEWLNRDIASFLVSEVQRLYPEYECGGMLV